MKQPDVNDELTNRAVELTERLVAFDTAYGGPGSPAGDEAQLQDMIAGFLSDLNFEVKVWEPDPADFAEHPMYPAGLEWTGRPVLAAVRRGAGGGRSLSLNGHIDTVRCEPLSQWVHDPWTPAIEGDRLYGRGACDMKGGIAAALAAVERVVGEGGELLGDLHFQTAPDEETSGMGTVAMLHDAERADACLVPEPSSFNIYEAYRGILYGNVTVSGRPAHAEIPQPHHSEGGGVNAIDLMRSVLDAFDRLNEDWNLRADKSHPLLSRPRIFPTRIAGGEFIASLPGECSLDFDLTYLPADSDDDGFGSRVRAEVEALIQAAAQTDSWLRENPPVVTWTQDYPPAEAEPHGVFTEVLRSAASGQGLEAATRGFDTWADAATYLLEGVPAYCFGPSAIERAHMIDEYVLISELGICAEVIAQTIDNWCNFS